MTVIIKVIKTVDGNKVVVPNKVPPYKDGTKTETVKADLAVYGAGFLLQNDEIITDENLSDGEYEYALITHPSPLQGSKLFHSLISSITKCCF